MNPATGRLLVFVMVLLCGLKVFVFLPQLTTITEIPSTKSPTNDSDENEVQLAPMKRRNLIILSQGRGGSSLLGELFNNHPDVLYFFEPLHAATTVLGLSNYIEKEPPIYRVYCSKLLESFFRCKNFTDVSEALPKLSTTAFRHKSKALTGKLFCDSSSKIPEQVFGRCAALTNATLTTACKHYKHTVVKVLSPRLPNKTVESFRDLVNTLKRDRYDVKFINLIRDPRAVVYSWVTLKWIQDQSHPDFGYQVHKICAPIEKNIRVGLSLPSWLHQRFKIVSYEDLVANMTKVARQLYAFAGFEWSREVEKWIREHTENPKKIIEESAYSMYRNGTVAMNLWKEAPETLIRVVQDVYGDIMNLMGYERWRPEWQHR